MRIAILSSYGIACGVADYAADLARGYRDLGHDVQVFTERWLSGATEDPPDLPPPERCFLRQMYDPAELADVVLSWDPDVISVEHEFGIWPDDERFLALLSVFYQHTNNVIVTLHTVPRRWMHREFFRTIPTHTVVHHPSAAAAMSSLNMYRTPRYVPHGISVDDAALREARTRRRTPTVLMPGFLSGSKCHHEILEAMNHSDDWELEIVGEGDDIYTTWLDGQIDYLGLRSRARIRTTHLPRAQLRAAIANAGCVVLNTMSDNFSASGQAADCIAVGAMTASKAQPIYDSLTGLGFKFGHPAMPNTIPTDEIGNAIRCALASVPSEEQIATMRLLGETRSWKRVAAERLHILGAA